MGFARTSYLKHGGIIQYIQSTTIDSAQGYIIFSFEHYPRVSTGARIEIHPYGGDWGTSTTEIHFHRAGISISGNAFNVSYFVSGSSGGSLADDATITAIIKLFIGSSMG